MVGRKQSLQKQRLECHRNGQASEWSDAGNQLLFSITKHSLEFRNQPQGDGLQQSSLYSFVLSPMKICATLMGKRETLKSLLGL